MASLVTTTITGTLTGSSSATFDSLIRSKNQLRVSNDYAVNYFYKTDNNTMLGYLLMRDDGAGILSFPTTQQITIQHGNTVRVAINTNGNVGINTSSHTHTWADNTLTVKAVGTDKVLAVEVIGTGTGESALLFGNESILRASIVGKNGSHLTFNTNATNSGISQTERMRIQSGGNVGIGTNNPASKLHVYGGSSGATVDTASDDLIVENSNHGGISLLVPDNKGSVITFGTASDAIGAKLQWDYTNNAFDMATAKAGGFIRFKVADQVEAIRITADGNIGIGEDVPLAKLQIEGTDIILNTEGSYQSKYLYMRYVGAGNTARIRTDGEMTFETGGGSTEQMRITNGGSVGIGTNAPSRKLHVNGSVRVDGDIRQYSTAANSVILHDFYDNTGGVLLAKLEIIDNTSASYFGGSLSFGQGVDKYVTLTGTSVTGGKLILETTGSAPSITLNGNGDTIFNESGAAYDFRIEGDTEQNLFFVDGSSDRIGIGTNSPNAILEIRQLDTSDSILVLRGLSQSNYTTQYPKVDFYSAYDAGDGFLTGRIYDGFISGGSWTDTQMRFAVPNSSGTLTDVMTLRDGNVGIGTTSPDSKLEVVSGVDANTAIFRSTNNRASVKIQSSGTNKSSYLSFINGSSQIALIDGRYDDDYLRISTVKSTGFIAFETGSQVEKVRITADGSVGIGTNSPDGKLHVHAATAGTVTANSFGDDLVVENSSTVGMSLLCNNGGAGYIYFGDPTDNDIGQVVYDHNSNSLIFVTNAAERMRINTDGNVGIGTNAPSQKLHVNGTIKAGIAGNSSANTPALLVAAAGTSPQQSAIAIQQGTNEGDTIIFADYEPYVEYGINTDNGSDTIEFTGGTSTNNLGYKTLYNNAGSARTAYKKHIFTLGNGNFYAGGSVGIGTNAPSHKLHVYSTAESALVKFDGGDANNWIAINSDDGKSAGIKYENAGTGKWFVGHYNNAANGFSFFDANTGDTDFPNGKVVVFIEELTGNVGIGKDMGETIDPINALHVHGSGDGHGYIRITDASLGSLATDGARIGFNSSALRIQNYENTSISFFVNNTTEVLTLNNNGTITFNDAYTFPNADGSANQILKTDGSGTLSWANAGTSGTSGSSGESGTSGTSGSSGESGTSGSSGESGTSGSSGESGTSGSSGESGTSGSSGESGTSGSSGESGTSGSSGESGTSGSSGESGTSGSSGESGTSGTSGSSGESGTSGSSGESGTSGTSGSSGSDGNSGSDRRFKTNISKIENALSTIDSISGMSYTWSDVAKKELNPDWSLQKEGKKIGFIAQDLLKALPESVYIPDGGEEQSRENDPYLHVDYGSVSALLVEAIKELNKKTDSQQLEIDKIKKMLKI